MPGDAVQVALEKAAEAAWLVQHRGCDWHSRIAWVKLPGVHQDIDVRDAREIARDAIAAFLLALPDGQVWRPSAHPYMCGRSEPQETLAQLAAAVARAGGGA